MLWPRGGATAHLLARHLLSGGDEHFPDFGAGGGIKFRELGFEDFGQGEQLGIRHAAHLRLDFGQGAATQVPAGHIALGGEHILGPGTFHPKAANLRTDNVLRRHCSEIGA